MIEILFKIPQEHIENISLKFDLNATIEQIKKQIQSSHALKPAPHKQKILYAGKLRQNEEVLKDVLGSVSLNIPFEVQQ